MNTTLYSEKRGYGNYLTLILLESRALYHFVYGRVNGEIKGNEEAKQLIELFKNWVYIKGSVDKAKIKGWVTGKIQYALLLSKSDVEENEDFSGCSICFDSIREVS